MFLRLWGESYLKTMKDENNIKIRAVQWTIRRNERGRVSYEKFYSVLTPLIPKLGYGGMICHSNFLIC